MSPRPRGRPSMFLLLVGSLLLGGGSALGYFATSAVRSPAQVLAETKPPPLTVLTERVVRASVSRSVAFEGTVEREFVQAISAPTALDEGAAVVTRLPRQGQKLSSGSVAAEVSGRPVMLLEGRLPAYRTLSPGDSGPDVAQLQSALRALDLLPYEESGVYGPGTTAAIASLYESAGYESVTVGRDEVDGALDVVRSAERSLEQLRREDKPDPLSIRFATEDLARARAGLAELQARAGAQVPLGEVVFVPKLPATVAQIRTSVGETAEGELFSVSSGPLVVRGSPVQADARRIRRGQSARLLISPVGEAEGRVAASAEAVSDDGGSADEPLPVGSRSFTVDPARTLRPRLEGAPVRIIVSTSRSPRPGLAVPISAVSATASGTNFVVVVRDGKKTDVPVTTGFIGDGLVQVTPRERDALHEGDAVAVGTG